MNGCWKVAVVDLIDAVAMLLKLARTLKIACPTRTALSIPELNEMLV